MEFWLMQDNDKFRLPINPEMFEHSLGKLNSIVNITDLGEVNVLGKSKLSEISLESFFPYHEYYFCEYVGFPSPYECVSIIKKFMEKGQVRLLITETDINKIYYIEDFRYGERNGSKDVYYSISFREYKSIKVKTISSTTSTSNTATSTSVRPASPPKPTTYTIKKGDTLWAIAKKYYGDGNKYKELASKNNIKNPDKIYVGQVITI